MEEHLKADLKKGISIGRIKESVLAEQRGHFSFFPNIALRVVLFGVWRYWLKVGLCRPEFAIAIAGLLLHDRRY